MELKESTADKPAPYEPIDGLYEALGGYTISAILDGSVTPEDLVYTAYCLAGWDTIGCTDDLNLMRLAREEIEDLIREHTLAQPFIFGT